VHRRRREEGRDRGLDRRGRPWSDDGAHVAWWQQPGARLDESGNRKPGSLQLVVDGRVGEKWEAADELVAPHFTRDGAKVAAAAQKAGLWYVVVSSRKGEQKFGAGASMVMDVAWRPDGLELAWSEAGLQLGPLTPPRDGPAAAEHPRHLAAFRRSSSGRVRTRGGTRSRTARAGRRSGRRMAESSHSSAPVRGPAAAAGSACSSTASST
jgi:hypothetical protein